MKKLIAICTIVFLVVVGCTAPVTTADSKWAENTCWYDGGKAVNDSLADVFYIVSTEILSEIDSLGNDSYIGKLTPDERKAIEAEMAYAQSMFGDSLNFFSPYYEQFTMSSLALDADEFAKIRQHAQQDVADAFRYYIKHLNNGRPFILAGFSQGAMHLIDILRDIDDETYQRMTVAYCMGYRLSADDMAHPHVKAAKSADDRGVVVSFNSVATADAAWPAVSEGAATCINPVNYRTDNEPASFVFEGDTLSVSVDTLHNILIVSSPNIGNYRFPPLENICPAGNLHHWDLLFYKDHIRRNALRRGMHS